MINNLPKNSFSTIKLKITYEKLFYAYRSASDGAVARSCPPCRL